jgi:hypothetical protein
VNASCCPRAAGVGQEMCRPCAARRIGCSVSWLARVNGNGPPSFRLAGHVRYTVEAVEGWIKEQACRSTNGQARSIGGTGFNSPVESTEDPRVQGIAERLRLRSAAAEPLPRPRHLIAVPEEDL